VAEYPFTTLYPHLGVVRLGPRQSFVIADVPGLIAGAAEGAGLGTRFLKHLSRTRLLLHLIDAAPPEGSPAPIEQVRQISAELSAYGDDLAGKARWLVLNKTDLLQTTDADRIEQQLRDALPWDGPLFRISAATGAGTDALTAAVMQALQALDHPWQPADDDAAGGEDAPASWHPLD
jgi:GTP-binding protein